LNGRIAVLPLAAFLVLVLVVPVATFAVTPEYTTLGCPSPLSYTAPSLSFTSSDNSVKIYVTLASGNAWTGLSANVGTGNGGSVTFQFTDPTGIAQGGLGTASSSPGTVIVASSAVVSGQWILTITGTSIPAGQSIPVTATVQATASCSTTSTGTNGGTGWDWTLLVMIVVVGISLYVTRGRGGEGPAPSPTTMPPPTPSGGTSVYAPGTQVVQKGTQQYYAGLELPNGQVIPVTSMSQDFGRGDFENIVPKEVSNIISRRHFQISFSPRDKSFYIEDVGSTNGTKVNATDIKGKGKYPLKTGDVISPADVINLKFKG
jgi:hypothetical protein